MKRPIEPKTGWVWLKPGYTFSLQPVWPPGFEPQDHKAAHDYSALSTKARNTALDRGHTGSILGGLSNRSMGIQAQPEMARVTQAARQVKN